jgi:uncharacterized protein involved in tolerance to divalent cations
MPQASLLYVTTASQDQAMAIGRQLLEELAVERGNPAYLEWLATESCDFSR